MNTTIKEHKKSIFSDIDSTKKIFQIIKKNPKLVSQILENKNDFYRIQRIEDREITPSLYGLRHIHNELLKFFKKRIIFPKYIHGSVKGKSQKTSIIPHVGKEQVFKFDIRNFYPSIKTNHIIKTLTDLGMAPDAAKLVAELCTFKGSLPQGVSVAPILANLVFLSTSKKIYHFCKNHKLDFTVYMDDLAQSGNKKLYPYWGTVSQIITQSGFTIAKEKTRFMSKDGSQNFIKLTINTMPRPNNDYLKKLTKEIKKFMSDDEGKIVLLKEKKKTETQMHSTFRGRINYVRLYSKKTARRLRGLLVRNV